MTYKEARKNKTGEKTHTKKEKNPTKSCKIRKGNSVT